MRERCYAAWSRCAGWLGSAFLRLNVGVWIFFVLSGFLLYQPFARAHADVVKVAAA